VTAETTRWPWLLDIRDVITIDPRTGHTGEWRVTSWDRDDHGETTVVTCELPDRGEAVLVYHGAEKATIRLRELYSEEQRDRAMKVLTCGDRAYIAGFVREHFREVFDQALKQVQRRVVAEVEAKEITR